MKHKRIVISISILVILFVIGLMLYPVLYYVIVIRPRIYYRIDYNINLTNEEKIIEKVENFDYSTFLNYDIPPDPFFGIKGFVDADLIRFLKSRIEDDTGLRRWPWYEHTLRYSFLVENHSQLYLTYNNNKIFSIKDQNNQSFSMRENFGWDGSAWYLNFTQIPYVYDYSSTVMLNDFILVEINLDYLWQCGYVCCHEHSFEQYLVLNENLDIIVIFIHYFIFID